MNGRMGRRALAGALTAATLAAVIGLGQSGPAHGAHGQAVPRLQEAAVNLPDGVVPPGDPGGAGQGGNPVATPAGCPDVEVVFARGTGEAPVQLGAGHPAGQLREYAVYFTVMRHNRRLRPHSARARTRDAHSLPALTVQVPVRTRYDP